MEEGMKLRATARALVCAGKGILAVDESTSTCNKRFAAHGIEGSEPMRRAFRELLLCAPGLNEYISGAILYDETLRQSVEDGRPFVEVMNEGGIFPGIKVDTGLVPLAGAPEEHVTQGLDGLRERIREYFKIGARFAKWRAVFVAGERLPSAAAVRANVHALARYAALAQEGGLVPIVEPEVLMDGSHAIEASRDAHERVLRALFEELALFGVARDAMILKCSMVIAGAGAPEQAPVERVAAETLAVVSRCVPPDVAGIAFLSGGQSDERATLHLDAINRYAPEAQWPLTFSYGRALQQAALSIWGGKPEHAPAARRALLERASENAAASRGRYRVPAGVV
jgi:fructose-bisphosphate aldolase, class I